MQLFAITGGIGSGKSRVAQYLAATYSLPLLDLDQICKQLLQPEQAGWLALKELLTEGFFTPSGQLDRRLLREAIFTDASLRASVDARLHPLARQEMLAQYAQQAAPVVLAEIPLLFEVGWQRIVEQIMVVYAPVPVRLQRLRQRDQVSKEQALQAINSQECLFSKARQADYVIDNSRDWSRTLGQLQPISQRLFCGN